MDKKEMAAGLLNLIAINDMLDRKEQIAEMEEEITPILINQIWLERHDYNLLENQERYNGMDWNADFHKIAELLYESGYRLCGGDSCPNYKHYKADCEHCARVMEIRQTMLMDIAKKQAIKSFADKLKAKQRDIVYKNGAFTIHGVGVSLTDIDKAIVELNGVDE